MRKSERREREKLDRTEQKRERRGDAVVSSGVLSLS